MEAYFEFAITCNEDIKELLIAELAELEYEGFIEMTFWRHSVQYMN